MSILYQKVAKGKGMQISWANDGSWFITDKEKLVNHICFGIIYVVEDDARAISFVCWKFQARFGWLVKKEAA